MRNGRRGAAVRSNAHRRRVVVVNGDRRIPTAVYVADLQIQRVRTGLQGARCGIILTDAVVGALQTARLRGGYAIAVHAGLIRALGGGATAFPPYRDGGAGNRLPICGRNERAVRQDPRGELSREREEKAADE